LWWHSALASFHVFPFHPKELDDLNFEFDESRKPKIQKFKNLGNTEFGRFRIQQSRNSEKQEFQKSRFHKSHQSRNAQLQEIRIKEIKDSQKARNRKVRNCKTVNFNVSETMKPKHFKTQISRNTKSQKA